MARQLHVTREVRVLACIIALVLAASAAVAAHAAADALPGYDGGQVARDAATVSAHESDSHLLALWRLSRAGGPAGGAIWELCRASRDKDWRVRWLVVQALAGGMRDLGYKRWVERYEPQASHGEDFGIDVLRSLLSDEAWEVRAAAAKGLRDCGAEAAPAADTWQLIDAAGDERPEVSEPMIDLLAQVIQRGREPLETILRNWGADSSSEWDTAAARQYDAVISTLGREHWDALQRGEAANDSMLPAWLKLSREQDKAGRRASVPRASLARAGAPLVPHLMALAGDAKSSLRVPAIGALGVLGRDAAPAVPLLASLASDADPKVREAAIWTLGAVGPAGVGALPQLSQALGGDDKGAASAALQALLELGPLAAPVAPQVVPLVRQLDPNATRFYLYSDELPRLLGAFGPAAGAGAADVLAGLVGSPAFGGQASDALKKIAPAVGRAAEDLWQHKGQGTTDEGRALAAATTPEERRRVIQRLMQAELPPPEPPLLPDKPSSSEAQAWFDAFVAGKCTPQGNELARVLPLLDTIPDAALPRLWEDFKQNSWTRDVVTKALVEHDPEALSKFTDYCHSKLRDLRYLAYGGLAACGPAAKGLAPDLLKTALDEQLDPWERTEAARALEAIGPAAGVDGWRLVEGCVAANVKPDKLTFAELARLYPGYEYREDEVKRLKEAHYKLGEQLAITAGAVDPKVLDLLIQMVCGTYNPPVGPYARRDPHQDRLNGLAAIAAVGRMGHAALEEDLRKHPPQQYSDGLPRVAGTLLGWLAKPAPPQPDWYGSYSGSARRDPSEALADRCAAAQALGKLGCTHDSVIRALLDAALDDTPSPPEPVDPRYPRDPWEEKLKMADPPLRRAAVEALTRLAGWK